MIPQARIDEIAKDAVVEAVGDLIHDRMGLAELLSDDLREDTPEDEQEKEMDRLEAAIRLHLPGGENEEEAAPDVHCTICGGIVTCTDGDWWHEKDGQDLDHDASPPDDDQQ